MDSEYVLAVFDAYYKHNIEGTLAAFSTNVSETLVKELVAGGAEIENYVNDCLEQTSLAGISVVAQDYVNKWVGQIPLVPDDLFKFIPDEMAENIRKGNADHEELKLKNLLNVLPLDIFSETYKELEKDLKYSNDYHPVSAISGEYVGKIIKAYLAWEISKDINNKPVGETSYEKSSGNLTETCYVS